MVDFMIVLERFDVVVKKSVGRPLARILGCMELDELIEERLIEQDLRRLQAGVLEA
jgi:hypothetical protein